MIDPRPSIVERRLAHVAAILAVASGKGGVGKSTCATVGALALAARGISVGLLDLDFQGASCHAILGVSPRLPEEDRGLLPLEVASGGAPLRFATVASFIGESPAAMRGADLASMLRELLAVTIWGRLDVLVLDMPPGIHDTALELSRLVPRCRTLVLAVRSSVALAVTARLVSHLRDSGSPVAGIAENMAPTDASLAQTPAEGPVERLAARHELPFLGSLAFDAAIEEATAFPGRLAQADLARALAPLLIRAAGHE